jgi:hypothetical protein
MGIDTPTFLALAGVVKRFVKRPVHMASFGYPDLVVNEDVLRRSLPDGDWLRPAQDGESIARWHHWPDRVYDTNYVLEGLGVQCAYFDINPSRGFEEKVDLNESMTHRAQYDIVLDAGTTEHCFNIGQALKNVRDATKEFGYIIHTNPLSMVNHGFWNFNPGTYIDFYGQNGDELVDISVVHGRLTDRQSQRIHTTGRIHLPPETSSLVIVRKTGASETKWPTQSKYLQNKDLKG